MCCALPKKLESFWRCNRQSKSNWTFHQYRTLYDFDSTQYLRWFGYTTSRSSLWLLFTFVFNAFEGKTFHWLQRRKQMICFLMEVRLLCSKAAGCGKCLIGLLLGHHRLPSRGLPLPLLLPLLLLEIKRGEVEEVNLL